METGNENFEVIRPPDYLTEKLHSEHANKGDMDDCNMIMVWKSSYKHEFSMAVKKQSKYYEAMNKILMIMDSSGQLLRLHKKYFKEFKECKSSGVKSIGFDKLGAVFILSLIHI